MDEATGETETQDFMNVESFSQLPFIRRPKDKNPKPIRVFGKDFTGGDFLGTAGQEDYSDPSQTKKKEEEGEDQTGDNDKDINSISNNRRFECHYCFRNFPTSQALGGHQNAHKRERQLAKRGVSSYFHHPDTSFYSYRHYPSWTSSPLTAARSYGRHFSAPQSSAYYTQPRYGSPLGLWRVPRPSSSGLQSIYNSNAAFTSSDFSSSSNSTLSLLAGSQPQPPLQVGDPGSETRTSSDRYGLSPNVQDHVSLDLHL